MASAKLSVRFVELRHLLNEHFYSSFRRYFNFFCVIQALSIGMFLALPQRLMLLCRMWLLLRGCARPYQRCAPTPPRYAPPPCCMLIAVHAPSYQGDLTLLLLFCNSFRLRPSAPVIAGPPLARANFSQGPCSSSSLAMHPKRCSSKRRSCYATILAYA